MSFASYKALRVYKDIPTYDLFNMLLCNRLMKSSYIVSRSDKMYSFSKIFLGKAITHYIIKSTFCKALTAGASIDEVSKCSDEYFRKHNIPVVLGFCAEGAIGEVQAEETLDNNADVFAKSSKSLKQKYDQMIAVKITSIIDIEVLEKINLSVIQRDQFWRQNSKQGKMTAEGLFEGLSKMFSGITNQQIKDYVTKIHEYQGDLQDFCIDEITFKMNHHPYYLYDNTKNQNFAIRLFFPLNSKYQQLLKNFKFRIDKICKQCIQNNATSRILVDAEQSYFQRAIQTFSQQMQEHYNKEKLRVIPTLQNYLRGSVQRSNYEVEIAKRKNLKFGAKLVRGAYLVEERRLAQQKGYLSPVVDNFQDTTKNYLQSLQLMLSSFEEGEVVVATHNEETIKSALSLAKQYPRSLKLSFAQLLGLADHLTWSLKSQQFRVYKYLPWATTEVIVPYMIRRAQELSQMRYPLDLQYKLLKQELKSRIVD